MEGAHTGQVGQSVSTLMDGEFSMDAAAREIARLKVDISSRDCWNTYHLIGDAIRGGAGAGGAEFCMRFSQRLALEPTVLAPRMRLTRKMQTYALSAAASVAAIAVVGWVALSTVMPNTPTGELAQAPSAVLNTAPAVAEIVTPVEAPAVSAAPQQTAVAPEAVVEQVQEYLLAHQGISPTTAIQGVTPYVRTVSNTGE